MGPKRYLHQLQFLIERKICNPITKWNFLFGRKTSNGGAENRQICKFNFLQFSPFVSCKNICHKLAENLHICRRNCNRQEVVQSIAKGVANLCRFSHGVCNFFARWKVNFILQVVCIFLQSKSATVVRMDLFAVLCNTISVFWGRPKIWRLFFSKFFSSLELFNKRGKHTNHLSEKNQKTLVKEDATVGGRFCVFLEVDTSFKGTYCKNKKRLKSL